MTAVAIFCLTTWASFCVLILRVTPDSTRDAERMFGVGLVLLGGLSSAILSALVLFSR